MRFIANLVKNICVRITCLYNKHFQRLQCSVVNYKVHVTNRIWNALLFRCRQEVVKRERLCGLLKVTTWDRIEIGWLSSASALIWPKDAGRWASDFLFMLSPVVYVIVITHMIDNGNRNHGRIQQFWKGAVYVYMKQRLYIHTYTHNM